MSWNLIRSDGEIYIGEFRILTRNDLPQLKKSNGWSHGLNWAIYLQSDHDFTAYTLHIAGNHTIQGLIAVAVREGYVELELAEKAPFNRRPVRLFSNVGEVLFSSYTIYKGLDAHAQVKTFNPRPSISFWASSCYSSAR